MELQTFHIYSHSVGQEQKIISSQAIELLQHKERVSQRSAVLLEQALIVNIG